MASVYWQPHLVLIKNDNAGIPVKKYKNYVLQLSNLSCIVSTNTTLSMSAQILSHDGHLANK